MTVLGRLLAMLPAPEAVERESFLGEVSGGEIVLLIVGGLLTILLVIVFVTVIIRAHRQERASQHRQR